MSHGARIGTLLRVLTVALSGCHSSGSVDSPASTEPSISIQASVAETIPPLVFYVPAANTPSTGLYGYSEFSGEAVTAVTWASHGGPSAPTADVTVQLAVQGDFAPGVVTGEARFEVCTDQPCTQQVRGSPIVVPVALTG